MSYLIRCDVALGITQHQLNKRIGWEGWNIIMKGLGKTMCKVSGFPGEQGDQEDWVCAKIPHDGSIKKDCVPKVQLQVLNITLIQRRLRARCNTKEQQTYTFFKEELSICSLVCFAGTS